VPSVVPKGQSALAQPSKNMGTHVNVRTRNRENALRLLLFILFSL